MAEANVPVTSVDAPSSWDIENGPPKSGVGSNFHPDVLVSLTAPKPLVKYFKGRHFIGGRYVPLLSHFLNCVWAVDNPDSSPPQSPKSMASTCRHTKGWTRSSKWIRTVNRWSFERRPHWADEISAPPSHKSLRSGACLPIFRDQPPSCCLARREAPPSPLLWHYTDATALNLTHIDEHPPFFPFGHSLLVQPPSFMAMRLTVVPLGHLTSGGRKSLQNST